VTAIGPGSPSQPGDDFQIRQSKRVDDRFIDVELN
jgi:hypothetical protein